MRIIVKRRKGETLPALLRRFTTRFQRSGIVLQIRENRYYRKKPTPLAVKKSKLYRLRIKKFLDRKLKEGWSLEKALSLARKYVQYHKEL